VGMGEHKNYYSQELTKETFVWIFNDGYMAMIISDAQNCIYKE
jgi:hypothetical protein